ncbi:MAG: hypothetical protein A2Z18_10730 [Armatimonadetes bacterium RBG_16_58_9]|nr:MAG: hypothetical protein A2Z18_10730 [Armatimonadetes bacterium RBG_16_58_9]
MRKYLPVIVIAAALAVGVYVGYIAGHRRDTVAGPTLAMTFLDAEHGNGIIVRTPEGKFVVVDPGPAECARGLMKELKRSRAASVSVVVTKPSSARGGALRRLVSEFDVTEVYTGETEGSAGTWKHALERARKRGIPIRALFGGSTVRLSPTTAFEVLGPPAGLLHATESDWDNNSLVTRFRFGEKRFLLMSDARVEAECYLIQSAAAQLETDRPQAELESDVLVLGRNGRSGSTSLELLSRVRPESCVVIAGRGRNRPSRAILNRVDTKNTGAAVYRTDKDGTIRMVTDGHSVVVSTEGATRG